jgi:hypothetical protein
VADNKIISPDRSAQIVAPDQRMQDRFALWCQSVSDYANRNKTGLGSPEGVEDGQRFTFYIDTATNDFYVKTTEQGTLTGWKLL